MWRWIRFLFVVAACGQPGTPGQDASSIGDGNGGDAIAVDVADAPVDVPVEVGDLVVRVFDELERPSTGSLLVNAPDASLVQVIPIVDGMATATVRTGDTVSWVRDFGELFTVESVTHVKPGDDIHLSLRRYRTESQHVGTMRVTVPEVGPGIGQYWFYGPCSATIGSHVTDVSIGSHCEPGQLADLHVRAMYLPPDSNTEDYFYLDKVTIPVVEGSSVMVPGPWKSMLHIQETYRGLSQISGSGTVYGDGASSQLDTGMDAVKQYRDPYQPPPDSAQLYYRAPPSAVAFSHVRWWKYGEDMWRAVYASFDGTSVDRTVDLIAMPWLDPSTFVKSERRIVTTDRPATTDLVAHHIRYWPGIDLPYKNIHWGVYGPRQTSVTLPKLPAEFEMYESTANAGGFEFHTWSYDVNTLVGYDGARREPATWFMQGSSRRIPPVGTVVHTVLRVHRVD